MQWCTPPRMYIFIYCIEYYHSQETFLSRREARLLNINTQTLVGWNTGRQKFLGGFSPPYLNTNYKCERSLSPDYTKCNHFPMFGECHSLLRTLGPLAEWVYDAIFHSGFEMARQALEQLYWELLYTISILSNIEMFYGFLVASVAAF